MVGEVTEDFILRFDYSQLHSVIWHTSRSLQHILSLEAKNILLYQDQQTLVCLLVVNKENKGGGLCDQELKRVLCLETTCIKHY